MQNAFNFLFEICDNKKYLLELQKLEVIVLYPKKSQIFVLFLETRVRTIFQLLLKYSFFGIIRVLVFDILN